MWPLLLFSLVYIFKIFKQSREAKLLLISYSGFAHDSSGLVSINLAFWTGRKGGVKLTCILWAGWNSWICAVLCCYCLRSCSNGHVTQPLFPTFLNRGFGWIFCLADWVWVVAFFLISLWGERQRIFGQSCATMF